MTDSQVALEINYFFFILAFNEFICIIKVYDISISKSKTLSDPSILDKGYQNIFLTCPIFSYSLQANDIP
jgi:hypothetical protein